MTLRAHVTEQDQFVYYEEGEHSLRENFDRFHAANPHVYAKLVQLTRRWKDRTGTRCGIGMLYEVCRWQIGLRGEGEPLHLNNNYRAFYARLIMETEDGLEGMFETRRQRNGSPEDLSVEPGEQLELL